MNSNDLTLCQEKLRYFGSMLPAFAHEAKNGLAVINENAGLLGDYILLAQRGKDLNLEKLGQMSAKIKAQVNRLDTLITDVRRAADGIDNGQRNVCLIHHVRQVSDLLSRNAATRSIQFHVEAREDSIAIHTRPVLLLHMIWSCLDYAMHISDPGRHIKLIIEKQTEGGRLNISGISSSTPITVNEIMPEAARHLVLSSLEADLTVDKDQPAIALTFSASPPVASGESVLNRSLNRP